MCSVSLSVVPLFIFVYPLFVMVSLFWEVVLMGEASLGHAGHILQLTSPLPFLCLLFASVEASSPARLILLNLGVSTGHPPCFLICKEE